MKVKIGMKGEKRVNRLIKNIAKSAQIVIAIFVVYYDVSIKETLHLTSSDFYFDDKYRVFFFLTGTPLKC